MADSGGGTAAATAVHFCEDDAREAYGLVEFFCLGEAVGAGCGVHNEPFFVGEGGVVLGESASDFFDFAHEVLAGVESAGGIAEEEIYVAAAGGLVSVVAEGSGVGLVLAADELDADAVCPRGELLDGRGAEGIGGGEEDGVPVGLEAMGEFSDGGGFACAVDADEEDGAGAIGVGGEGGR